MKKNFIFIIVFLIFLNSNNFLFCGEGNFTLTEAVNLTLKKNTNILLQKENVNISKSSIKISQSKFDTIINPSISYSHTETPITPSQEQQLNTFQTNFAVSKQLRTGISLNGGAQTSRVSDIHSPLKPAVSTTIYFSLNVPLLEGLGKDVAAADELSSISEFSASKLKLAHTVSEAIYRTAVLYWNYLMSVKNLNEYKQSLKRTEKILEQVKILIEKNFRPRADLDQILASYANKKATVLNGEQQVISSKNALAIYLGLNPNEFKIVSYPATNFPEVTEKDIISLKKSIEKIKKMALNSRFDYLALIQNEKTIKIQLKAAKNKLKNNLDLNVNVSYKRLDRDESGGAMITGFWENRPGFNVNVLLNYKWPVENSYAKGLVLKYFSLLNQNKLNEEQLKRTIISNIETALSDVEKSYKSYLEAITSVRHYEKAIFNEKQKYKLGMSTIIDVINLEDKLTAANLNKISVHYKLATAIAKLRYETGKLIEANPENQKFRFNIKNLISLNGIIKGE